MLIAFFFFNDTATTEIYTLSLHDALPICDILFVEATRMKGKGSLTLTGQLGDVMKESAQAALSWVRSDRKSTRLNSSHSQISYAVFCLKKKKTHPIRDSATLPP